MYVKKLALYLSLIFIFGCIAKGKVDITLMNNKSKQLDVLNLNVAQVSVVNDQLVVDGSNLNGITSVKLVNNGVEQTLTVESSSASQLIANGITAVTLNVGQVFDMILSTANAAATVPVIFSLNNNSVTAAHLTSMGALSGQVLKFNGTSWAPASLIDAQLYKGTWDPATILPDVGLSSPGDYWVISAAGTNAGNGITYAVGDWIISDGYTWSKLALSKTSVTSFNGRKGLVNLIPGDYPNLKSGAKIPGSSLNDLANVDITTVAPINGDVLKFNGTNWVAGAGGGGGAGSVGSTEITDLSITGGDIAENTINPSKIYSSSNDAALYLRGDKTWANFVADVLNVPLSTYALDATTKPTVLVTDKIGPALGKIQKFLNDLNTDYISKTATSQSVSGSFSFTSPTSFLYTQTPTGVTPTEVTNVSYVQSYVASAMSALGFAPSTLTTASAATSSDTTLTVVSTANYPTAGTLLIGNEAIIYTGKTATTFTGLTRGAFGTTAAAITGGAMVNNYVLTAKSTDTVTPKMVVTGNGNVGIGTASPSVSLHVVGPIRGDNGSNDVVIQDGAGNTAFRGLRAGAYSDNLPTQWFQIGNSGDSSVIAASSGSKMSRFGVSASSTLISAGAAFYNVATPVPVGVLAVANSSNQQVFNILDSGNVGIGTTAPSAKLSIESTNSATSGTKYLESLNYTVSPPSNSTATNTGILLRVETPVAGAYAYGDINGMELKSIFEGSIGSTASKVNGADIQAYSGGGTVGNLNGLNVTSMNSGSGGSNSANVTNLNGINVLVETDNPANTTNSYGVNIYQSVNGPGTVTNRYGVFIDADNYGTVTNDFGIYQNASIQKNYFAGNVGIGTSTPTAKLEVSGNQKNTGVLDLADSNGTLIIGSNILPPTSVDNGSVLIGSDTWAETEATTVNLTAVGNSAGGKSRGTSIGKDSVAGTNSVALGFEANSYDAAGVSIGAGSTADNAGVTIGYNSYTAGGTAIGNSSEADMLGAIAIGHTALAGNTNSIAIGNSITNNIANSFVVGLNGTPRLYVSLNSDNVGIGLTNPTYQLQLSTDSAAKPGTSTWTIASDERLKDIRAPFTRGLKELNGLHTVYFNYKENNPLDLPFDKEYVGIKAQDVIKVIPEAVSKDEKGFFHVTNDSIIWTAINAIKELYNKFLGVETKVKKLEAENVLLSLKIENEKKLKDQEIQKLKNENTELKLRLDKIERALSSK